MKSRKPVRPELTALLLAFVAALIPAIILAIWARSIFSFIYVAVVAILAVVSSVRSRKTSGEEMMRRQNQTMGKTKDDPAEMARWVP